MNFITLYGILLNEEMFVIVSNVFIKFNWDNIGKARFCEREGRINGLCTE
jgi:hypothetical protein